MIAEEYTKNRGYYHIDQNNATIFEYYAKTKAKKHQYSVRNRRGYNRGIELYLTNGLGEELIRLRLG